MIIFEIQPHSFQMTDIISSPTETKRRLESCVKCHNPLSSETLHHQLTWVQNKSRPAYLYDGKGFKENIPLDEWPQVEQINISSKINGHRTRYTFFVRQDNMIVKEQIQRYASTKKPDRHLLGIILGYLQPWNNKPPPPKKGTEEHPLVEIKYFLDWLVDGKLHFAERYEPKVVSKDQIKSKLDLLKKGLPDKKVTVRLEKFHSISYAQVEEIE